MNTMSINQSITIDMIDGKREGRYKAIMACNHIIAYGIPILYVKGSVVTDRILEYPGVFMFLGVNDITHKEYVYVGASTNVALSLVEHAFDDLNKTFFDEVLVFIDETSKLQEKDVMDLKNSYCKRIKEFGRFDLLNTVYETDVYMDPYGKNAEVVIDAYLHRLRYFMLDFKQELILNKDPFRQEISFVDDPRFHIYDNDEKEFMLETGKDKSILAYFLCDDQGIHILKNSYIEPNISNDLSKEVLLLRDRYKGCINQFHRLECDILMHNYDYAASFVRGKNTNGLLSILDRSNVNIGPMLSLDYLNKPVVANINKKPITWRCVRGHAVGFGQFEEDHFVLLKGSTLRMPVTPTCPQYILDRRNKYDSFISKTTNALLEDIRFESTSAAASFVFGQAVSGNTVFKDENGRTITEVNAIRMQKGQSRYVTIGNCPYRK